MNSKRNFAAYKLLPVINTQRLQKIYVNGVETSQNVSNISPELLSYGGRRPTFSLHSFEDERENGKFIANSVRIGEISTPGFSNHETIWNRNFSGDYTIDEFSLFGSGQESDSARESEVATINLSLMKSYSNGRYYVPRSSGNKSDCAFESGPIYLNSRIVESKISRAVSNSRLEYSRSVDQ